MEPDRAVADLELFLADRGDPLLRTAVLLGGSKETGEDLLQAALERLLRHWPTIEGNPRRATRGGPSTTLRPTAGGSRAPGGGSSGCSGPASAPRPPTGSRRWRSAIRWCGC
jgi:hypothetical protein